jgi:hypothetical protein
MFKMEQPQQKRQQQPTFNPADILKVIAPDQYKPNKPIEFTEEVHNVQFQGFYLIQQD